MRTLFSLVFAVVLGLAVVPSYADLVPYANVGTVAPTVPLYAASTGNVMAYFAGANTAGNDYIRLVDVTQNTYSAFVLSTATSTVGQAFNLGAVTQGDVLVFQLINYALMNSATGTYPLLASNPTYSDDKINHTYVSSYAGGGALPSGTYLAFEDYLGGYDLDYNDDTFVGTNLSTSAPVTAVSTTPEPGSLLLLGTGMLTGVGTIRQRSRKSI